MSFETSSQNEVVTFGLAYKCQLRFWHVLLRLRGLGALQYCSAKVPRGPSTE